MKTTHIIILIVLYLIYRQQQNRAQAPAPIIIPTASLAVSDSTLRRDMEEKISLLEAKFKTLEPSAFA